VSRGYGAAGAITLAAMLSATHVAAQMPPPANMPPSVCVRLESQLASLDQGGGGAQAAVQRLREAVAKQRSELDRTVAYARGLGCDRRMFLFGPTPPAQCGELNSRMASMRTNLDRMNAQMLNAGGSQDAQRRQLIAALGQNNCGPQYRSAALPPPPVNNRRQGGLFSMLFGGGGGGGNSTQEQQLQDIPLPEESLPRASTWRTVCVRTCDGFFYPVSYSTVPTAFPRDEAICKMTCPGTEAKLFAYPNPGGSMDNAVSPSGEQYTAIPNAFKYRTEFVSGCGCRPEGMSWAEALAGIDDRTLRKGDIIVDEAKSEALSRPKAEAPPKTEAARRPAAPPQPAPAQAPPAPTPEFDPFNSDSTAPVAAD
jgi:hypothetical protein